MSKDSEKRGGKRENAGRHYKWKGEQQKSVVFRLPASVYNDLASALDFLWNEVGLRGSELVNALRSLESSRIRLYQYPASAGLGSTESFGGETIADDYEEVNLLSKLIPDVSTMFILPVTGDSMVDVGIYDQDWLIVQETEDINDGDIVVVSIDGETLVKRYRIENNRAVFYSENSHQSKQFDEFVYEPIYLTEDSSYKVSGVVTTIIGRNPSRSR